MRRVLALRRLIRKERPDVVHTTLFESDVVGRFAAAGTRTPVVSSLVNTPYDEARLGDPRIRRSRLAAARILDGWTARRFTSHFHAITEAAKRHGVDKLGLPPGKITVIERGRDPDRFPPPSARRQDDARRALGLARDEEILVTLGRQEHQKGQSFLLEAVAKLVRTRPRIRLLVAGRKGEVSSEIEAMHARLGLGDRVTLLGHREDVPDLLAAADVFVFPSLWEGLGGSLIEALASGLPVVATRLDAVAEVIADGRNGLLVRPGSAEELAGAITWILDDPRRRAAMGAENRALFERRFSIAESARALIDLYRAVARRGPLAPERAYPQHSKKTATMMEDR